MEEPKRRVTNEPGRRYAAGSVESRTTDAFRRPESPYPPEKSRVISGRQIDDSVPKAVDGIANVSKKRSVSRAKPALPRAHRSLVLKRHIVERANQHRKQVRREHKRHFASMVVSLVIISALAVLSWVFWDFLPVVKSVSIPFISQPKQAASTEPIINRPNSNLDQNRPSEGEVQTYQAAADAPRLLRIPKLDIEARVKRVGSSLNGEPISPSNIFDVGWYDDSSKPGKPGAVLINGHIAGSSKNGVFYDLGTLELNDVIEIERGDGVLLTYIVSKVQAYSGDQIDMNTALQSIDANSNGLNLMTSSSNYDGGVGQSNKRVIVFAIQK
jgi:sortase (surface protein transpeptidase)